MKVIFMGTSEFAAPSLKALINDNDHEVVSVFTQRPKPKGRGYVETLSPIHQIALNNNIPTYTPKTLRVPEIQQIIHNIEADLIVVVAYGFIIPKEILESKKYGCFNIHPSKLPRWRGAAPLQRTIIAGDNQTAVSIMQMDEGLDTGDILMQQDLSLKDDVTLPELHDICAKIGAELLIKTIDNIDNITPVKQSDEGLVYAHKLTKEESKINFNKTAFEIDCMVRGMNPWPGVYFEYEGEKIKVLEIEYFDEIHEYDAGYVIDNGLKIACKSGFIIVKRLQRPGKKVLSRDEFLNGMQISSGKCL